MYFILSGFMIPMLLVGIKQAKINNDADGKIQKYTGYVLILLIYIIGIIFF